MKLYCVYSEQFTELYKRFFEASLRKLEEDIEIVSEVFQVGGNGDFRSGGFNQALIYKWKYALEALYQDDGKLMLLTDVDIIFNKQFVDTITKTAEDQEVVVSPEGPDIETAGLNVGIVGLRSTPGVRGFISQMLDEMILRNEWDQRTFNLMLPKTELRYKALPVTFANGKIPYNSNSVLYHATCTIPKHGRSSLEMKWEALSKAEEFFQKKRSKKAQ